MPKPAAVTPAPAPHAALIDELGDCDTRLAPLRTLIAREDALRKQLRAIYADDATDGEIPVQGTRFTTVLGPRGNQTAINIVALVKRIRAAAFAKFAVTTLAALKENVAPDVYDAVTSSVATGPRSLKTYPKGNVA